MNENIVLFLKKLGEDTEVQEKFKTITNPDEAYAIASAEQAGFTKEEFIEAMTNIKTYIEDGGELSDEDLAKTAGGMSDETRETVTVIGICLTPFVALGGACALVAA